MPRSSKRRLEVIFSVIPVVAAVVTAIAGAVVSASDIWRKLEDLFRDPVTAGLYAGYAAFVAAIFTVVLLLLTRSIERRTSRQLSEGSSEPAVSAEPVETAQGPPPSPAELAARERERNFSQIRIAFTRTRRRMMDETERIQRNGLLNLAIGILFSVIALGILGYPLLAKIDTSTPNGWIELFERLAPRFSVGILVQVIGFFFLRLYVAGEREVHYLRNELTNWEARLIAYSAALATKDAKAMRENIKELSRLERNFKLRKGERSLYETDETYNDVRQLIADAFNALGQSRSKTKSKSEA